MASLSQVLLFTILLICASEPCQHEECQADRSVLLQHAVKKQEHNVSGESSDDVTTVGIYSALPAVVPSEKVGFRKSEIGKTHDGIAAQSTTGMVATAAWDIVSLQDGSFDPAKPWAGKMAAKWKTGKFGSVIAPSASIVQCLVDGSCHNAPAAGAQVAQAAIGMVSALAGIAVSIKLPVVGMFVAPLLGGLLRGLVGMNAEPGQQPLNQNDLNDAMRKIREELRDYTNFAIARQISNNIAAELDGLASWYRRFVQEAANYGFAEGDVTEVVANLDSICPNYDLYFMQIENELARVMRTVRANFQDFLSSRSGVLSNLLDRLVPAVLSYQSALRMWWVTCSNHTEPGRLHRYANEYEETAREHQKLLFSLYSAWESAFRRDLETRYRNGGWGAATSTPEAWNRECSRPHSCTEPGGDRPCRDTSFRVAQKWSERGLAQRVDCTVLRNRRGQIKWIQGGDRTIEGGFRCYFPQFFDYRVCAPTLRPDELCESNQSLRIHIQGLQGRAYYVRRASTTSVIGVRCIASHYNPTTDAVKHVYRQLVDWALNDAIARKTAVLAPAFFLGGPLYGPGADKFNIPSDSMKSVKVGPISFMTSGHPWGSDPMNHRDWSSRLQSCGPGDTTCAEVDVPAALNGACPTGIAGMATFFGDEFRSNPWVRGIYGVGLYELNETSGLPQENPCHALLWDQTLYEAGTENGGVTAFLAPSASVYDLKVLRYRYINRRPGTPTTVVGMVEFEFALRDEVNNASFSAATARRPHI